MISRDSALLHTVHRLCYDTMDWAGWGGVGEEKRREERERERKDEVRREGSIGERKIGERRGGKIVEKGMG